MSEYSHSNDSKQELSSLPTLLQPGMYEEPSKIEETNTLIFAELEKTRPIDVIIRLYRSKLQSTGLQSRIHILKAYTGAGKSTVYPQELFIQLAEDRKRAVLMAEPRKVLCDNNINDILNHNSWELGDQLVIKTGTKQVKSEKKAYIEFATTQIVQFFLDRILEANSRGDSKTVKRLLNRYLFIVIDEAHILEKQTLSVIRSVKEVLTRFNTDANCPIFVFSSATIDAEQISKYFEIELNELTMSVVKGLPNHPIATNFLSDKLISDLNERGCRDVEFDLKTDELKGGAELNPFITLAYFIQRFIYPKLWLSKSSVFIKEFNRKFKCRDLLVFVPGIANINQITSILTKSIRDKPVFRIEQTTKEQELKKWRKANKKSRVLIIGYSAEYSQLSLKMLESPYESDEDVLENELKIIVSTGVIETGKTIQTLYACIDAGFDNKTIHSPLVFDPCARWLIKAPANQNQIIQRKGRVGRMSAGVFVAMYSKDAYSHRPINDYPDTVNSGCLSSLFYSSHLSFINRETRVEIGTFNSYLYPITPDLFIRSAQDLFIGGIIGAYAQWLHVDAPKDRWIAYAIYAYYVMKYSLFRAVMTASLNRYKLPDMFEMKTKDFDFQMSLEQAIETRYIHAPEFIVDGRKLFRDIVAGKNRCIIVFRNDVY